MELFTIRLRYRYSLFVSSLLLILSGCSGSGGDGDDNPNNNSGPGDATDQIAFQQTVFPLLRANCSSCHGETGTNAVKFAQSDLAKAHALVVNRRFVDLESPSNSLFVARLNDGHNCGTTCTADALEMTIAIEAWADIPPAPLQPLKTSIAAFSDTLHPILRDSSCIDCHGDNGLNSQFAVSDSQAAHDQLQSKDLVNLAVPSTSTLVTYLSVTRHQCGTEEQCDVLASQIEAGIADWENTIVIAPPPQNKPPIAQNDTFTTTVDLTLTTGNVLLNDNDPDGDTLAIRNNTNATSTQGGQV
ncbi:MAG: hypothetical protein GXP08_08575, partial [Gammaproteobacteria bacterium]|nr:hypothetical protein [Gammaproteobacteria bacterium]